MRSVINPNGVAGIITPTGLATDGRLLYDEDGNGALADVQFAILTGAPGVTFSDFVVA